METPLPNAIADYNGILRDEEIRAAIQQNFLLTQDTSDLHRVRQASYELRLSDSVEFLRLQDGDGAATARYERPANGIGNTLSINPGQTLKVQVMEAFNLPNDVVAHVVPVGNIYKIGLSPETTFADPGFEGPFYIVLANYSTRVVELSVGQPIARVEFVKLQRSTTRPHPGARHVSEPPIWPRRVPKPSIAQLSAIGLEGLLSQLEKNDPPHYEHAYVTREVRSEATRKTEELKEEYAVIQRLVTRLENMECSFRRMKIGLVLAGGVTVMLLFFVYASIWWPLLPESIQKGIPDGIGKAVGSFLAALILPALIFTFNKFKIKSSPP